MTSTRYCHATGAGATSAAVVDIADAAADTVGAAVSAIAGHSGWTIAIQFPASQQTLSYYSKTTDIPTTAFTISMQRIPSANIDNRPHETC